MGTRLSDSPLYAHLWGTPEMADLFAEERRLQSWLDILVALARAQAKLGIVPPSAADSIASKARVSLLDLELVAAETRRTSHSTLGLIHALERVLGESARYVYLGATVQDVTDTWFGLVMRDAGALVRRDLRAVEATLLALAARHRDTVLAGRTHGQPGSPTTFGLKAASWADELRRHVDRLREGRPRWAVGQLAGAVGTLAFFGSAGPDLRAAFCAELGLGDPGISWLTARDRVSEFAHVLAMITATLARIGGEVYELQRPEIGELREPAAPGGVGSITMPHKRNPEAAEHLGTLAMLARSSAGVLLETMVQQHERDGRGWKAEWIALPEVCLLTGSALSMARGVTEGLEVDAAAMSANLHAHGVPGAEQVLAHLSARLGKHAAQRLLHSLLRDESGPDLADALAAQGVATVDEVREWLADPAVAVAGVMVDGVVARARRARAAEEAEPW
jgi:adenylosuccinate lyase